MPDLSSLMSQLPVDQIAAQVGASPEETQAAISAALPALVGGLHANAQDPAGAASLASAVDQHDGSLVDNLDAAAVDQNDGAKIVSHIFGQSQDEVVNRLGGAGSADSGLIAKVMPILAPIVMAWLAKQIQAKMGGQPQADQTQQGGMGDILGQVLGGALSGGQPQAGGLGGGVLGTVLGGLLGGGRR